MAKWRLYRKIHSIVKVAKLKRKAAAVEQRLVCVPFFNEEYSKIDAQSEEKQRRTNKSAKERSRRRFVAEITPKVTTPRVFFGTPNVDFSR